MTRSGAAPESTAANVRITGQTASPVRQGPARSLPALLQAAQLPGSEQLPPGSPDWLPCLQRRSQRSRRMWWNQFDDALTAPFPVRHLGSRDHDGRKRLDPRYPREKPSAERRTSGPVRGESRMANLLGRALVESIFQPDRSLRFSYVVTPFVDLPSIDTETTHALSSVYVCPRNPYRTASCAIAGGTIRTRTSRSRAISRNSYEHACRVRQRRPSATSAPATMCRRR